MPPPRPRPTVMQIAPYTPGISALAGRARPIKLSSNEGAFGMPPAARAAVAACLDRCHRYPDGTATRLRQAIGAAFGLDPERIVCGAGSDDLIFLLCHIYGGPGTELIMTEHGFSIYEIAGQLAGGRVVKVAERGLTADAEAILRAVTPATTSVFLANPNNPTGTLLTLPELRRLRAALPEHVLLVLDGAYAEYVERADYDPGTALVDEGVHTVMTRTFSKIFGMGGLRLGWAYAPAAIVDVLHRARAPFNVSLPAHEAGIAALAEPGWIARSRAHNTAERARLGAALAAAGIRVHPSEANFLLADFGSEAGAAAADARLRGQGIIVRRVGGYGLPHCLRITVGRAEENEAVIAAFAQAEAAHG